MELDSTATEQPAESIHDTLRAALDQPEESVEEPETTEEVEEIEEVAEASEEIEEDPQEEAPEDPEEPKETGLEAPSNWSQEDKELFSSQPKEVQQYLLNRHKAMEGDYTRKMQEIAPLREYEPVHQIFAPYMQQLKQAGTSPAQMIQSWAHTYQNLQSNPAETIRS